MNFPPGAEKPGDVKDGSVNWTAGHPARMIVSGNAFARSFALKHKSTGSVCSYIPKNACSTLRYSVLLDQDPTLDIADPEVRMLDVSRVRAEARDLTTASHTFVILRCPYQRLVSMFLDKMVGSGRGVARMLVWNRMGHKFGGSPIGHQAAKVVLRLGLSHPRLQSSSFRDLVSFLELPGALQLDIHWRPQSDFLVYEKYDDVFCVEDLATAKQQLSDRGFQLCDARSLTRHDTEKHKVISEGFFGDASIAELAGMKKAGFVPTAATFYDKGLRDRVFALYARDFAEYAANLGPDRLLFQDARANQHLVQELRP